MGFYGHDNFYPDHSIGYLLRVINQLGHANLDRAMAAEGIGVSQWSVLVLIHFGQATTCGALARDMAHDKGAMTRIVDTLEERGWVSRVRDGSDRRQINLTLSPAGLDVAMRCRDTVIECWNGWLADWSELEIVTFITQLQKLRRTLEANPPCAA